MYKIYCDMDGVLTDFDNQFKKYTGVSPDVYTKTHSTTEFWGEIEKAGIGYWVGMNWMPEGKKLWNFIKKYDVEILSAPSRSKLSVDGKKMWVKTMLKPRPKLNLVRAVEKQKFTTPNSILIDDKVENINQWKSAGGIGILATRNNIDSVIQKLKKYYEQ
jgi:5'(3')-deoxyribonucleotidase